MLKQDVSSFISKVTESVLHEVRQITGQSSHCLMLTFFPTQSELGEEHKAWLTNCCLKQHPCGAYVYRTNHSTNSGQSLTTAAASSLEHCLKVVASGNGYDSNRAVDGKFYIGTGGTICVTLLYMVQPCLDLYISVAGCDTTIDNLRCAHAAIPAIEEYIGRESSYYNIGGDIGQDHLPPRDTNFYKI